MYPDFDPNGAHEIEIVGAVSANEGNIDPDVFMDRFIEFVEANGWSFGGGLRLIVDGYYVDVDGNPAQPID